MDFDGLIVDTEVLAFEVFKVWFSENLSYDLPLNEFIVCVGSNYPTLLDKLEAEHGLKVDPVRFFQETQVLFKEKTRDIPARPGVEQFIKDIKKEDLLLGLATSSALPKPQSHLTRLGLISFFDCLTTADDVERIKPAPDLFLKALQKLGVAPEEALVVEDSQNGFIAASAAGIRTLVVPNAVTRFGDFSGCYLKLDSLSNASIAEIRRNFVNGK